MPERKTEAGRVYRGAAADARRTERRAKLLAAGLELFGTRGINSTRIDDICGEAGLTKRYFYENFASIGELLNAVYEQVIADLAVYVVPAIAEHGSANPRPAIEAYLRPLLRDPRLIRIMVVETATGSLAARRQATSEWMVDTWLAADPHADPRPEAQTAQRVMAHAMMGATAEVCLAWANDRLAISEDDVIDHLARIFVGITASLQPAIRAST